MKIGIIGAGNIGSILARHFRQLQHTVLIANSRGPETLSRIAQETGAIPVPVSEAANGVDLLVLTIPMKGVPSLPKDLLAHLPATAPIIDTGNYYPPRDGQIREIDAGLVESEWTSRILGRPVIKVFNNIVADSLLRKGLPKGAKNRIALPVAGDNPQSKRLVMDLVEAIGFDAFDAGSLSESWRYQPGTPAYCPDPTIEQLSSLLERADPEKAPKSRDNSSQLLGKVILEFPQPELVRVVRLSSGLDRFTPRSWMALARLLLAVVASRLRGSSGS
jgi:8-hydroxy-5-deazaflavin:NADPH oxidoreductase